MINRIHFFFALLVILVITPQNAAALTNKLLRSFQDSGIFATFAEAKRFLNFLTRFSIFIFLTITLLRSI